MFSESLTKKYQQIKFGHPEAALYRHVDQSPTSGHMALSTAKSRLRCPWLAKASLRYRIGSLSEDLVMPAPGRSGRLNTLLQF